MIRIRRRRAGITIFENFSMPVSTPANTMAMVRAKKIAVIYADGDEMVYLDELSNIVIFYYADLYY